MDNLSVASTVLDTKFTKEFPTLDLFEVYITYYANQSTFSMILAEKGDGAIVYKEEFPMTYNSILLDLYIGIFLENLKNPLILHLMSMLDHMDNAFHTEVEDEVWSSNQPVGLCEECGWVLMGRNELLPHNPSVYQCEYCSHKNGPYRDFDN